MKHHYRHQCLIHILLLLSLVILLFPIYVAFIASTHTFSHFFHSPIPLLPGHQLWHNYQQVLTGETGTTPASLLLLNSFIMASIIAIGKVILAILSAFSLVYFSFRFKKVCFWLIMMTLMLPVQVRIVPTFSVAVNLHILNSFTGLTLPLLASATATFMFRQFFMTIPEELIEAAQLDGANPWQFFYHIILPLSKTNIVALLIIMFIYGWNQYLWPLVSTGMDPHLHTIVMALQQLASVTDRLPPWNQIMATVILATLPPVLIVVLLQKWFVKGLIQKEK